MEITLRKRWRRGMGGGWKRAASGSYVSRWLVNVSGGARKRKRGAIRGTWRRERERESVRHNITR